MEQMTKIPLLLLAYLGMLTLDDNHFQGQREGMDYYMYYFDCHVNTSEQVLSLSDAIYWLDGVDWAEPNMYIRIHYF